MDSGSGKLHDGVIRAQIHRNNARAIESGRKRFWFPRRKPNAGLTPMNRAVGAVINFWQQSPLVKVWVAQTALVEAPQLLKHSGGAAHEEFFGNLGLANCGAFMEQPCKHECLWFGGATSCQSEERPSPRARVGARGIRRHRSALSCLPGPRFIRENWPARLSKIDDSPPGTRNIAPPTYPAVF